MCRPLRRLGNSRLFLEGLRDPTFRSLFIPDEADYVSGKGREISEEDAQSILLMQVATYEW